MAEIYLRGAIQKEPGRLHEESVRFLQIGCGIGDFQLPIGRRRFSVVDKPPLKIATEKNGELAEGVASGKYHWGIVGLDMVENLPDELRDKVVVVRELGFQPCLYRLGVSASTLVVGRDLPPEIRDVLNSLGSTRNLKDLPPEIREIIDGLGPKTLDDLRPYTRIATKHDNYLERVVRQRGLFLKVQHDSTPEIAPDTWNIGVVADIVRSGDTFLDHNISYSKREVLLESQAVLIKARRFPRGVGVIFNDELLPRVDEALENPERWFNPDTSSGPEDDGLKDLTERPRRRLWLFNRMSDGLREIVAVSAIHKTSSVVVMMLTPLLMIGARRK